MGLERWLGILLRKVLGREWGFGCLKKLCGIVAWIGGAKDAFVSE
jgi:hypothetical protein